MPSLQFRRYSVLLLFALSLAGCGTSVYYVVPSDLNSSYLRDSTIASYSRYLKDKTVFIDPGHGGEDRSGKGPEGDVVEADVNLEVALNLREFLMKTGANVIVSRESDITVPLTARAEQANVNKADVFISIHHNAAGNRYTNYTATFYHSKPGQPGYQPSSHDLARYIQRDLSYVLGTPGPLASFDGTMSDYLIYPGEGFSVLRNTQMTAVLVECAFFTSAYEEQRLAIPQFNEIEAWGIFRGIGKYFRAGIPSIAYQSPTVFADKTPSFQLIASDPSGINDESIQVRIDGKEQGFLFDKQTGALTVKAMFDLSPGFHELTAQVRNNNGNSSAPFSVFFAVGAPPSKLRARIFPAEIPPDPRAFSYVVIEALDSLDRPCPDGTPVRFSIPKRTDTTLTMKNGMAMVYIEPGDTEEITFTASNGPIKTGGSIKVVPEALYSRGVIMSADGKPVANAVFSLPDGSDAVSNANGEYIIAGKRTAGLEVKVHADGYFGIREALNADLVQDPIVMNSVARGILRGLPVFIELTDAGGASRTMPLESNRIDIQTLLAFERLMVASGATVVNLSTMKPQERIEALASSPDELLLQFSVDPSTQRIWMKRNAASETGAVASAIATGTTGATQMQVRSAAGRSQRRSETDTHMLVQILLPPPGRSTYPDQQIRLNSSNLAWGIYSGILQWKGYRKQGTKNVEVTVLRKDDRSPAQYAEVILNDALRAVANEKGIAVFRAVSIDEDNVTCANPDAFEVGGVKTEIIP